MHSLGMADHVESSAAEDITHATHAELIRYRARQRELQDNETLDAQPLTSWLLMLTKHLGARVVEAWLRLGDVDPEDEFEFAEARHALQGALVQVAEMAVGAVESLERRSGCPLPDSGTEAHSAQVIDRVFEHIDLSADLDLNLPQRICRLVHATGMFAVGGADAGVQVATEAVSVVLAMEMASSRGEFSTAWAFGG